MVSLFALSLADQAEKYGAYAGIAAFFGLAVLSLLYFAQAREVKRLREWAGRAPERAREIEERAIAQAEAARVQGGPRAVPQPVGAAAEGAGTPPPAATAGRAPAAGAAAAVAPGEEEARATGNGTPPPGAEHAKPEAVQPTVESDAAKPDGDGAKAPAGAAGESAAKPPAPGQSAPVSGSPGAKPPAPGVATVAAAGAAAAAGKA